MNRRVSGWSRVLGAASAAAVLALLSVVPGADASPAGTGPVSRLMSLDPGGLTGAETAVGAVPGARVSGVSDRPNFIVGLGARERVVGGAGADQLGVRAMGSSVFGGAGNDLIHGAPAGHDRLSGGSGNDLIDGVGPDDVLAGGAGNDFLVSGGAGTTVFPGAGHNVVDVANGARDRVVCAAGSVDPVYADRGDRIGAGCHGKGSRVLYRKPPKQLTATAAVVTAHAAGGVTGNGTNADPYVAPCDNPGEVDCSVAFPRRLVPSGLWSGASVPAYKCPAFHDFLLAKNFAPWGTALPKGVEIVGLGPVGISITGASSLPYGRDNYATGTLTGYPNSSATNWYGPTVGYRVILHCTSELKRGWVES